jgi:hypothetical protein
MAGGARLLECVRAALEKLHISQHRQTGRAVFGIALRDIGGDKVLAQHAFGWTGFFDLGNHGRLTSCNLVANRTQKITGQYARLGVLTYRLERFAFARGRHLLVFDRDDGFQNVRHIQIQCVIRP